MDKSKTYRNWLNIAAMILPPVLFISYLTHSLFQLRDLVKNSSSFHVEYANKLIQEYIELELIAQKLKLENCQTEGVDHCFQGTWFTNTENGEALDLNLLRERMASFVDEHYGLSAIVSSNNFHEPVYWFRIRNGDQTIFEAYPEPTSWSARSSFKMQKELEDLELDVIYQSFGAKQLFAVAKGKLNFGLILFLFVLAVLSLALITRNLRNTLVVARQKTFFVRTISHEFKTPLAIMNVATETLEQKRYRDEEDQSRFLSMIRNEINRMGRLVHKVLQFSKIEAGHLTAQKQEIDLHQQVVQVMSSFQFQAQGEQKNLEYKAETQGAYVYADAELIQVVLENIVDNALKFSEKGQSITFDIEDRNDWWTIIIRDRGLGMEPKEHANIVRSFYRIPDHEAQGIRGTGLGLHIAQKALAHCQGSIQFKSGKGEGTTVFISIPKRKKDLS